MDIDFLACLVCMLHDDEGVTTDADRGLHARLVWLCIELSLCPKSNQLEQRHLMVAQFSNITVTGLSLNGTQ